MVNGTYESGTGRRVFRLVGLPLHALRSEHLGAPRAEQLESRCRKSAIGITVSSCMLQDVL